MELFLKEMSEQAGQISLDFREKLGQLHVEHKSKKDLVSEADKVIEEFIVSKILKRFPDHSFLGEESGVHQGSSEYRWVIDPIDGTNSFIHDQPFYSISIALEKSGGCSYKMMCLFFDLFNKAPLI